MNFEGLPLIGGNNYEKKLDSVIKHNFIDPSVLLVQDCGTVHEGIVLGTYLRRVFGKSTEGHGS